MSTLSWLDSDFDPGLFDKLSSNDDLYKALGSSDLSDVVVEAIKIMKTRPVREIVKEKKDEPSSTAFREEGNIAFKNKNHYIALRLYNKALRYAPADSEAMKLAYSDRSALFMTTKAYGACMSDIDIVLDMGCPPEILEKLQNRKQEACEAMRSKNCHRKTVSKSDLTFCTLKGVPNPLIPCATKNVGFVMENNIPKIIATDNIEVGTVLAIEPAFVSYMRPEDYMVGCYYCHRLGYHLVPCEGCCRVMFCNKDCMRNSMDQLHSIECGIIDVLNSTSINQTFHLAVKAAIKIKLGCSWEKFIDYTKLFGPERTKKSSIRDIFSHLSPTSMLHFKEERHFIHGAMYQAGLKTATIIHYLGLENGFFPDSNECSEPIKAFARLIMYLYLHGRTLMIRNAFLIKNKVKMLKLCTLGFFSFAGNLKMSCLSNVMTVGLNTKVALIAQQPISKGTELTICPGTYWAETLSLHDVKLGQHNMFFLLARVCNCVVCSGEWKRRLNTITLAQRQHYVDLSRDSLDFNNYPKLYKKLCKAMNDLHYVPFTQQYIDVYRLFRVCISYYQHVACENRMMDDNSANKWMPLANFYCD